MAVTVLSSAAGAKEVVTPRRNTISGKGSYTIASETYSPLKPVEIGRTTT
jgi:hypothetical protein